MTNPWPKGGDWNGSHDKKHDANFEMPYQQFYDSIRVLDIAQ